MKNRNLKSFKPGQSGNRRGRPPGVLDMRALAKAHTAEAIKTLAEIMRSKRASSAARVSASNALLDRGWGRPNQEVTGANGAPLIPQVDRLDISKRVAFLLSSGLVALAQPTSEK